MADHKIDGNVDAGNVDLIRRIDAMQACQVAPSDEWAKATKDGYNQAATDCAMAILRVAPVPAANDEVASYKMASMECELECKALRAQRDDAWVRADHALALAADVIDRDIKKIQPEMTRRGQRLADGKKPGFQYAIHRADLDARISCRDKILAIRDKPAPGVCGWQPIETAPENVQILVCQTKNGIISIARGKNEHSNWRTGISPMDYIAGVTHWMPLPAPPED